MNSSRRGARQPYSNHEPDREPTSNGLRASTLDSGRGSMATADRASTLDRATNDSTSSYLSTGTPLTIAASDDYQRDQPEDDEQIVIPRNRPFAHRCYEQAFVSHVDHPSAFFLQLAQSHDDFERLHEKINDVYPQHPLNHPSWKRGEYCIVEDVDNQFYRARIIQTPGVNERNDMYAVVFVDFGNWRKVAGTKIHRLLPVFTSLAAQAIPCSLSRTLPRSHTWLEHPEAMRLFDTLVFEQYVDATFQLKSDRNHWPLCLVELNSSTSKQSIRDRLIESNCVRDVKNEDIYPEFHHLLKPADYIIYSISNENDEYDDH